MDFIEYMNMPKNNIYSKLEDDLFFLYCKVKNPEIENIFIRFAAQVSTDVSDWILNNKRKLRSKVKNQGALDFLILLASLKKKNISESNVNEQRSKLMEYAFETPENIQSLIYLLVFDAILKEGSVREILAPFSDIINTLISLLKKDRNKNEFLDESEKEKILPDLIIINDLYNNDKQTATQIDQIMNKDKPKVKSLSIKTQKENMYRELLKMFSSDIADAFKDQANMYKQQGDSEKYNKAINAESRVRTGILGTDTASKLYDAIPDFIPSVDLLPLDKRFFVTQLANVVDGNYDSRAIKTNYDLVENGLLNKSRIRFSDATPVISDEDFNRIKLEHEKKENILDKLDPNKRSNWSSMGTHVALDKRTNPDYIYLLFLFFKALRKE